jgi:thiol:disulfide interchange protein DsbD
MAYILDSGLETTVEWDLPEGYKASDLEWATPKKIPYGDLTNYGYEDSVTLLQDLTVPANAPSEPLTINGKVNVLVCHDICIPETHDVSLTLNSAESFNADEIKMAQANLPKALEAQASHYQENSNLVLEIQNTDITFSNDIYLAPEQWGIVNNNADASIKQTDTNIKITQQRGDRDLAEVSDLAVVIVDKQNGQSHRIVAIPDTQKSAAITPNLDTALDTTKGNLAEKKSELTFATAFMFALLGGLILNLMPCVFPVLSMKALSLVQLSGKEESKAKQYGLSYTAGILISFGLIAGILIALKSAGAQIGWGFQLQNPVVISLLIYMIFLIGLNLSGFFELTGRFTNMGQNLASQSGNKGAFFTGVLATLVATPCTAPFMGAAMGYALTQGALSSMIVFLALVVGTIVLALFLPMVEIIRGLNG